MSFLPIYHFKSIVLDFYIIQSNRMKKISSLQRFLRARSFFSWLDFLLVKRDKNICPLHSSRNIMTHSTKDFLLVRALAAATSVKTKRYYFGQLKIKSNQINLSMLTASKLSPDLNALKRDMSLPLVKFEDAKVDLGKVWISVNFT